MFWLNILLAVMVVLVITLQTFDFGLDPSQATVSLGVVLIWTGASYVAVMACGRNWYKWLLREYVTRKRPDVLARYRHWGMEGEVLGDVGPVVVIFATLVTSCTIWFIIWFIAPATTPIPVNPKEMIVPLVAFFLFAVSGGMSDYRFGETRREQLDSLHPAFHARFPASEILSMHACLSTAPPVFWREYSALPDAQINKATNQEFRDRVSSYRVLESEKQYRKMLVIGLVAVAAAVPTLAFLILEGTLTQWLNGLFTAPRLP